MGKSPSHRFGQIIGEVLEDAVAPAMAAQAKQHNLYLDKKGKRPCRAGELLSWIDANSNIHNLDFVLERGGTDNQQGLPAAFIEVAWRRYSKHSRAKAQEIQGAIMPLLDRYKNASPFFGVILAGVFTSPSIKQIKSLGFSVLLIPATSIFKAFAAVGIDADATEKTPDEIFQKKVDQYEKLSGKKRQLLVDTLLDQHRSELDEFVQAMSKVLSRQIVKITILPLHGEAHEFIRVSDALKSLSSFKEGIGPQTFVRYEIEVHYDNGNNIKGAFLDKPSAMDFLNLYSPSVPLATKDSTSGG